MLEICLGAYILVLVYDGYVQMEVVYQDLDIFLQLPHWESGHRHLMVGGLARGHLYAQLWGDECCLFKVQLVEAAYLHETDVAFVFVEEFADGRV